MRIETALKIERALCGDYFMIWERGRREGLTQAVMLEQRKAALARYSPRKYPTWVAAHLSGYWHALCDVAHRRDLVFGSFVGGKFYSVDRYRADYYGRNGVDPRDYDADRQRSGFYWTDHVDKGEPRPFFIGSDTNAAKKEGV